METPSERKGSKRPAEWSIKSITTFMAATVGLSSFSLRAADARSMMSMIIQFTTLANSSHASWSLRPALSASSLRRPRAVSKSNSAMDEAAGRDSRYGKRPGAPKVKHLATTEENSGAFPSAPIRLLMSLSLPGFLENTDLIPPKRFFGTAGGGTCGEGDEGDEAPALGGDFALSSFFGSMREGKSDPIEPTKSSGSSSPLTSSSSSSSSSSASRPIIIFICCWRYSSSASLRSLMTLKAYPPPPATPTTVTTGTMGRSFFAWLFWTAAESAVAAATTVSASSICEGDTASCPAVADISIPAVAAISESAAA
mmetsp:Transcript_24869/g.71922  ORF Transcript_24869/g.71922 Transcript_24869/m.71922 type:complete len:312 (-) Transcript_24869:1558-2493(-)